MLILELSLKIFLIFPQGIALGWLLRPFRAKKKVQLLCVAFIEKVGIQTLFFPII